MKISELFKVEGYGVVVTGGASGLGLAYAEALAENGARVTLLDIDPPRDSFLLVTVAGTIVAVILGPESLEAGTPVVFVVARASAVQREKPPSRTETFRAPAIRAAVATYVASLSLSAP